MATRENYNNRETVNGTSAADSIVNGGSNVTISAGDASSRTGAIRLVGNALANSILGDFGDDDLLQINGTFSASYNASANTIAFKVGSTASALTLKNFTATTFNVNGNDYIIDSSSNKLVKKINHDSQKKKPRFIRRGLKIFLSLIGDHAVDCAEEGLNRRGDNVGIHARAPDDFAVRARD